MERLFGLSWLDALPDFLVFPVFSKPSNMYKAADDSGLVLMGGCHG
tara:strand:- start:269 stop:406 length:138 start_codon:yes stop_codon:yes gene_type:complete